MSKTKVSLTATQITEKWSRRMKGAVTDIQNGIDSVTESPMEKAAKKKDKMIQNLTAAVTSGRWEKGLLSVTLADWKQKTKDKVAARLSSGVDGAQQKRGKFDSWLVTTVNSILPQIASMPDMTIDDSVNRVSAFMKAMQANAFKK